MSLRAALPNSVAPRLPVDIVLLRTPAEIITFSLEVKEDTTSISLNILDLDIHSTTISSNGQKITSSPDISYNESKQTVTLSFDKTISAGSKAQIKQTFTGRLNDNMAGFYRSSYKHPDGTTQYLATSQMEPTDARRAFPCFDEPALKAEYTVTLIADKKHTCLSNMDQASEKEVDSKITGSKRKAVTFNKTPLMSTYLLAFIIGELNCVGTKNFRVPVRVFATPDKDIEHGRFSVELAAKTLEFYEKTFDSKFPLPKMDMAAIPDFSAGAMENWGLVTYRVVDLLFDEKTSGASTKQRVAEVVQHELAHQWYVTWFYCAEIVQKLKPLFQVRKPRNHGLLGWAMAQRRIRYMDELVLLQQILPRVEGLGRLCHRHSAGGSFIGFVTKQSSD